MKVLQDDYAQSQTPLPETKSVPEPAREPITFVRPEIVPDAKHVEEEDSEEDEDGIKGVYFEDEDGELAEFQG